MEKKIKILYIAGWGRSGSTILGSLLGSMNEFFHAGEIFYLWSRGIKGNFLCSCGKPFSQCETWQRILKNAYGNRDSQDVADEYLSLESDRKSLRTSRSLVNHFLHQNNFSARFESILQFTYQGISSNVGAEKIIVDSSKFPAFALFLKNQPWADVYIIHLVRDPRANAYSWLRIKEYEPGKPLKRYSILESSVKWFLHNFALSAIFRGDEKYQLFRYEEFVDNPRLILNNILSQLSVERDYSEVLDGKIARITSQHSIAGNPVRFISGEIEIKKDIDWVDKMSFLNKKVVEIITWPLLKYYGYK